MDRNHDAAVDHVDVKDEGDTVTIAMVGDDDADLALERYTATERVGLLAELLGAEVHIVAGA